MDEEESERKRVIKNKIGEDYEWCLSSHNAREAPEDSMCPVCDEPTGHFSRINGAEWNQDPRHQRCKPCGNCGEPVSREYFYRLRLQENGRQEVPWDCLCLGKMKPAERGRLTVVEFARWGGRDYGKGAELIRAVEHSIEHSYVDEDRMRSFIDLLRVDAEHPTGELHRDRVGSAIIDVTKLLDAIVPLPKPAREK